MNILNTQRMSTEDGPGLRTTVFFKGCPLHCLWCHNPESINFKFEKEWIQVRCIGCHECILWCPKQAISYRENEVLTSDLCNICGKCIDNCPGNAMQGIGKSIDSESLAKELIKDKAYFGKFGGVTLSGGEVMSQVDEAIVLCQLLKKEGIHIAIDTSGFAPVTAFKQIIQYVDLILYDLKLDDKSKHIKFCGVDNQLIKDNLIYLNQKRVPLWIRTPIIPNSTDSAENIKGIAEFLHSNNIHFERWELCAFNNLATDKYERLHRDWEYKNTPLITKDTMSELTSIAKSILGSEANVLFTGLTRIKEI